MSTSSSRSNVARTREEIARLEKEAAAEAKREADLNGKASTAQAAAAKASSISTAQSKLRDYQRALSDIAKVQQKRADLSSKIANKSKTLMQYQNQLERDEAADRKRLLENERKVQREREAHERRLTSEIRNRADVAIAQIERGVPQNNGMAHDFFISHASEDKESFVRPLADALRSRGAQVWYDDFMLTIGDSLRRSIDRGLASSRFGIVVLSEAFFRKDWTQRELDGLVALETSDRKTILPIWHKVSKAEVTSYSPTLGDKLALNSSSFSVDEIADELCLLISNERKGALSD